MNTHNENGQSAAYMIYVLKCPDTQLIKYVGVTVNPEQRFKAHLSQLIKNNKKTNWIKSLRKQNKTPIMEIIDFSNTIEEINKLEIYYIEKYSNLLNHLKGGYGLKPELKNNYSEEKIHKVCKLILENKTNIEIKNILKIEVGTICNIRNKHQYNNISDMYFLKPYKSKRKHFLFSSELITEKTLKEITNDFSNFLTNREISEKYGLELRFIQSIRDGQNFSTFTKIDKSNKIPSRDNMLFKLSIIIEIFENNKTALELYRLYNYKNKGDFWRVENNKLWIDIKQYYMSSTTIEKQRIKSLISRVSNKLLVTETGKVDYYQDIV